MPALLDRGADRDRDLRPDLRGDRDRQALDDAAARADRRSRARLRPLAARARAAAAARARAAGSGSRSASCSLLLVVAARRARDPQRGGGRAATSRPRRTPAQRGLDPIAFHFDHSTQAAAVASRAGAYVRRRAPPRRRRWPRGSPSRRCELGRRAGSVSGYLPLVATDLERRAARRLRRLPAPVRGPRARERGRGLPVRVHGPAAAARASRPRQLFGRVVVLPEPYDYEDPEQPSTRPGAEPDARPADHDARHDARQRALADAGRRRGHPAAPVPQLPVRRARREGSSASWRRRLPVAPVARGAAGRAGRAGRRPAGAGRRACRLCRLGRRRGSRLPPRRAGVARRCRSTRRPRSSGRERRRPSSVGGRRAGRRRSRRSSAGCACVVGRARARPASPAAFCFGSSTCRRARRSSEAPPVGSTGWSSAAAPRPARVAGFGGLGVRRRASTSTAPPASSAVTAMTGDRLGGDRADADAAGAGRRRRPRRRPRLPPRRRQRRAAAAPRRSPRRRAGRCRRRPRRRRRPRAAAPPSLASSSFFRISSGPIGQRDRHRGAWSCAAGCGTRRTPRTRARGGGSAGVAFFSPSATSASSRRTSSQRELARLGGLGQRHAGPHEQRLDARDGRLHRLGDLVVGERVDLAQQQRGALRLRKLLDVLEQVADVGALVHDVGGRDAVGVHLVVHRVACRPAVGRRRWLRQRLRAIR